MRPLSPEETRLIHPSRTGNPVESERLRELLASGRASVVNGVVVENERVGAGLTVAGLTLVLLDEVDNHFFTATSGVCACSYRADTTGDWAAHVALAQAERVIRIINEKSAEKE